MNTLDQLKQFLVQDPENVTLRLECAEVAIDCENLTDAEIMLKPLIESQNPKAMNLMGLIHMLQGSYQSADEIFSRSMENASDDPALQFNRAWALANLKKFEDALNILDDRCALSLPQAATLKVQLHHQLGQFHEAEKQARTYIKIFPKYPDLIGAASTVAMDINNSEWAKQLANLAPDHPEAMITKATLDLSQETAALSSALFEQVLAKRPNSARALIGKGLSDLLLGNSESARVHLDKGAESFGTHLGSWIASGWAYAVAGDFKTARIRFETAREIDNNFSEIYGSIGILDIIGGDVESGRSNILIAKRLNSDSASAALGQILILQNQGRESAAISILEKTLTKPIGENGESLAQAMIKMGLS